jgi:hypothetical protein
MQEHKDILHYLCIFFSAQFYHYLSFQNLVIAAPDRLGLMPWHYLFLSPLPEAQLVPISPCVVKICSTRVLFSKNSYHTATLFFCSK